MEEIEYYTDRTFPCPICTYAGEVYYDADDLPDGLHKIVRYHCRACEERWEEIVLTEGD